MRTPSLLSKKYADPYIFLFYDHPPDGRQLQLRCQPMQWFSLLLYIIGRYPILWPLPTFVVTIMSLEGILLSLLLKKIEKLHRMTLPCCEKLCLLYLGFGCSLLPMLLVRERHWYPSVTASTCFHWGFWHMIVSRNTLYSSSFFFEPFADRLWLKFT